jgi:hypothetical protein
MGGSDHGLIQVTLAAFAWRNRINMRNLGQHSWCSSRDLNWVPRAHKSEVLPLESFSKVQMSC